VVNCLQTQRADVLHDSRPSSMAGAAIRGKVFGEISV
jgi:hypothetical protein